MLQFIYKQHHQVYKLNGEPNMRHAHLLCFAPEESTLSLLNANERTAGKDSGRHNTLSSWEANYRRIPGGWGSAPRK